MSRRILLSATAFAALLAPAMAFASVVTVGAGENAVTFVDPPSTRTRAAVRAEIDVAQASAGWRQAGGELGWIAETAIYEFVDGSLVHSDRCTFASALAMAPGKDGAAPPQLYGGA